MKKLLSILWTVLQWTILIPLIAIEWTLLIPFMVMAAIVYPFIVLMDWLHEQGERDRPDA